MADNNTYGEFESYRKFQNATEVFKNTSGVERFFAYIGPVGKTLANNEVFVTQSSFVHPQGILARQALNRDIAAGNLKYSNKGVTFHHLKDLTGTTAKTFQTSGPGKVVAVYFKGLTDAAVAGTITVASTEGNIVAAATAVPLAAATTNKVKEFTLVAAGQVVGANSTITVTPASFSTNTGEVYVAIAYHTA